MDWEEQDNARRKLLARLNVRPSSPPAPPDTKDNRSEPARSVYVPPARGKERKPGSFLQFDRYPAYFVIGRRGAGKSVLLEKMLEQYYAAGFVVLDWNCAFDLESLHWCVEDWDRKANGRFTRAYPILIIIPRSKRIESDGRKIEIEIDGKKEMVEAIKTIYDDTPLHEILLQAHGERRVCIFSIYLYPNVSDGQKKIAKFLSAHGLPEVMRDHLPNVKVALGLRELKDLSSNRMLTHGGPGERESKRSLNFISAQARHARIVCLFDLQNPQDVLDALVRQEDYILVKNFAAKHHIPDWLRWLDRYIDKRIQYAKENIQRPSVVSINRLSANSFYCVHPNGEVTLEHNGQPAFRHHQEGDNAQALAGIVKNAVVPKEELLRDPMVKLEEQRKREARDKETLAVLQECLVMHEHESLSWDNIQTLKKIKDRNGKVMSGDVLGRKVKRYWKQYQLISLPSDRPPEPSNMQ